MKYKKYKIFFITISCLLLLFLAVFLRINNLGSNPPELLSDELANFCSAKSMIETGKDLWGNRSLYFSNRVEHRPPIYGYFTYLITRLFGEDAFGIRMSSVINGLIAIFLLFFLTYELTNSFLCAFFASFTMIILPWHIHYSRISWEPACVLTFVLLSLWLSIKGIRNKKTILIIIGFVLFSTTIYTYQPSPLYAFLLFIICVGMNYSYFLRNKPILFIIILISAIIVSPYIFSILTRDNILNRARRIFVFNNGINGKSIINFFINYIKHFTFRFLFIKGDYNLRHGAGVGILYWWMLPFIILGLCSASKIVLFKKYNILIYAWLLIYPIGAALTNDGIPHATRSIIGIPIFCLLTSFGLFYVYQILQKNLVLYKILIGFLIILQVIICISLYIFIQKYYISYPIYSSSWYGYGNKKTFQAVKEIEFKYKRASLSNMDYWGEIPLLNYYMKDTSLDITREKWFDDLKFIQSGSIIVIYKDDRWPSGAKLYKKIFDLRGNILYYILTID